MGELKKAKNKESRAKVITGLFLIFFGVFMLFFQAVLNSPLARIYMLICGPAIFVIGLFLTINFQAKVFTSELSRQVYHKLLSGEVTILSFLLLVIFGFGSETVFDSYFCVGVCCFSVLLLSIPWFAMAEFKYLKLISEMKAEAEEEAKAEAEAVAKAEAEAEVEPAATTATEVATDSEATTE